ncbi:carboxypeptidase B-like [Bactrocera dorsalis]|uniref:Carboxypeptidase B-like n=1 Tax=Bactrocera dorsalis TaxID=27457 RepID=A0ABM3JWA2_BACDO|nr:carboxypeptidase B-like [Bactrocera dorsalis]
MLLKALLLVAGVVALASAEKYDGYKVYEVTPTTAEQIETLTTLSEDADKFDFLSLSRIAGDSARVLISPEIEQYFKNILEQKNISYKLEDSNFGRSVNTEILENRLLRQLKPYSGTGRLGTERYYTQAEINAYLDDLAARYPSRVSLKVVGKSYEGRILKTITITNGDGRLGKNVILMDGGFHAREWISPASAVYAIGELVENFEENADLLLDYDWVVLPVVNADGYEYSQESSSTRLWRKTRQPVTINGKTCYGTDPNRNFDFHWLGKGASSDYCSITYAGPTAFSEPETVVVRDLIHTYSERGIMYLTLHSYGSYVLYPWGYTSELPETADDLHEVGLAGADAIKAYSGTKYTVGSSTGLLGEAAGASDDYAFQAGFPISFTMELPRGGIYGFDPPASSVDRLVKETWVGIRAMGKKVTEKYPLA